MHGRNLTRQVASALAVVLSLVFGVSALGQKDHSVPGNVTATPPVRGGNFLARDR